MLKITFVLAVLLFCVQSQAQELSSASLLQKMYDRYHGKWHSTLTFDQTTERYRNDSLIKTSTWYEYIVYPNKLRIYFDSTWGSNGIMTNKDSEYVINNNKLVRSFKSDNGLIFFLGGMYFMSFPEVLAHFKELHYDLSRFHIDIWKGKEVYVLGAVDKDEKLNQLWIDKEKMVAVRFISYDDNRKMEGTFEDQVPIGSGWSETTCRFFVNDHLLQVEKYHDLMANTKVDERIYDPALIGK